MSLSAIILAICLLVSIIWSIATFWLIWWYQRRQASEIQKWEQVAIRHQDAETQTFGEGLRQRNRAPEAV